MWERVAQVQWERVLAADPVVGGREEDRNLDRSVFSWSICTYSTVAEVNRWLVYPL